MGRNTWLGCSQTAACEPDPSGPCWVKLYWSRATPACLQAPAACETGHVAQKPSAGRTARPRARVVTRGRRQHLHLTGFLSVDPVFLVLFNPGCFIISLGDG